MSAVYMLRYGAEFNREQQVTQVRQNRVQRVLREVRSHLGDSFPLDCGSDSAGLFIYLSSVLF